MILKTGECGFAREHGRRMGEIHGQRGECLQESEHEAASREVGNSLGLVDRFGLQMPEDQTLQKIPHHRKSLQKRTRRNHPR